MVINEEGISKNNKTGGNVNENDGGKDEKVN